MRRREYLAGGLGLAAVLAGGAYVSFGGGGSTGGTVSPVTVETFDAPGSTRGTLRVPVENRVTVLEIFEPFCSGCLEQFPNLETAHERVGDVARFVSLVPQSSGFDRGTIVDMWGQFGGGWPVGIDPDDHFFQETFQAKAVPHTGVVAPDGTLSFSESGVVSTAEVETAVREAATE